MLIPVVVVIAEVLEFFGPRLSILFLVPQPSFWALGSHVSALGPHPRKYFLFFNSFTSTLHHRSYFSFLSKHIHHATICFSNLGFQQPSTIDVICNFVIKHSSPEYKFKHSTISTTDIICNKKALSDFYRHNLLEKITNLLITY